MWCKRTRAVGLQPARTLWLDQTGNAYCRSTFLTAINEDNDDGNDECGVQVGQRCVIPDLGTQFGQLEVHGIGVVIVFLCSWYISRCPFHLHKWQCTSKFPTRNWRSSCVSYYHHSRRRKLKQFCLTWKFDKQTYKCVTGALHLVALWHVIFIIVILRFGI